MILYSQAEALRGMVLSEPVFKKRWILEGIYVLEFEISARINS